MDTTLFTTVINPTDQTRRYGYLGAHGRELAAGEQYTHRGNLALQAMKRPRERDALLRDLDAGYLQILNTPAPILYDLTQRRAKAVSLDDGALGVAVPDTGDYSSSSSYSSYSSY